MSELLHQRHLKDLRILDQLILREKEWTIESYNIEKRLYGSMEDRNRPPPSDLVYEYRTHEVSYQ